MVSAAADRPLCVGDPWRRNQLAWALFNALVDTVMNCESRVPGADVDITTAQSGLHTSDPCSQFAATIDVPGDQVVAHVYLSSVSGSVTELSLRSSGRTSPTVVGSQRRRDNRRDDSPAVQGVAMRLGHTARNRAAKHTRRRAGAEQESTAGSNPERRALAVVAFCRYAQTPVLGADAAATTTSGKTNCRARRAGMVHRDRLSRWRRSAVSPATWYCQKLVIAARRAGSVSFRCKIRARIRGVLAQIDSIRSRSLAPAAPGGTASTRVSTDRLVSRATTSWWRVPAAPAMTTTDSRRCASQNRIISSAMSARTSSRLTSAAKFRDQAGHDSLEFGNEIVGHDLVEEIGLARVVAIEVGCRHSGSRQAPRPSLCRDTRARRRIATRSGESSAGRPP